MTVYELTFKAKTLLLLSYIVPLLADIVLFTVFLLAANSAIFFPYIVGESDK